MLRVGVIGVGSMGQNHARVFSEMADLVGVVDKDRETGKIVAERFNTESFENYEDLLRKGVDAVSIATPTALHYQVSKDAIESGVHVLVEKPMCSTIEEAEKLVGLAESAGLTLAVGHIERHNPVVDFAKKGIRDGRYGDVITISARRVSSLPTRIRDVGVILDLGIHDIDVMRYLLGSEVHIEDNIESWIIEYAEEMEQKKVQLAYLMREVKDMEKIMEQRLKMFREEILDIKYQYVP